MESFVETAEGMNEGVSEGILDGMIDGTSDIPIEGSFERKSDSIID